MSTCYGFTLHAEGDPKAIDELIERLDPHGVLRKARPGDGITVCYREPRKEGTALVSIWGENGCLNPPSAISLKDASKELGLEIEVFDDEWDSGYEGHYHYTPDGKTCVEDAIERVNNEWNDDPVFVQEEYGYTTFKEYATAMGYPNADDEYERFLDNPPHIAPFWEEPAQEDCPR